MVHAKVKQMRQHVHHIYATSSREIGTEYDWPILLQAEIDTEYDWLILLQAERLALNMIGLYYFKQRD